MESAIRCDCGFDFPSGQITDSYLSNAEQLNTKNKVADRKNHQIWGWIIAILGGVFTLGSVIYMFIVFYQVNYESYDPLTLMACILGVPGLIIGIPLLVLGIRRIIHKGD
jgi:drug/metabolite transporter superfamily protein YnfA